MYIELVFVWDDFGASTLQYVAVEKHPYTPKDETSIFIYACILPIRIRLVQQNLFSFQIMAHIEVLGH